MAGCTGVWGDRAGEEVRPQHEGPRDCISRGLRSPQAVREAEEAEAGEAC